MILTPQLKEDYWHYPFYSKDTKVLDKERNVIIDISPTKTNIELLSFGRFNGKSLLDCKVIFNNRWWIQEKDGIHITKFPIKPKSEKQANEFFKIILMGI